MGQVHHGSATTTAAVRPAIQHRQASLRRLSRRYGINPKTVAKWKKRSSIEDLRTGPRTPRSTVLTIEEATVKRFHYVSHEQLRMHLADVLDAYNFARRLKTLRGLTPFEAICKAWTDQPHRFKLDPLQQCPGPNS